MARDDLSALGQIAYVIVFMGADPVAEELAVARATILRANELAKSTRPGLLDTLARVHFLADEIELAVAVQNQAVALTHEGFSSTISSSRTQPRVRRLVTAQENLIRGPRLAVPESIEYAGEAQPKLNEQAQLNARCQELERRFGSSAADLERSIWGVGDGGPAAAPGLTREKSSPAAGIPCVQRPRRARAHLQGRPACPGATERSTCRLGAPFPVGSPLTR